MTRSWQLLLATLSMFSVAGCSSCRDGKFVAEMIAKESTVDRDFGRAPDAWSPAQAGDRFEMGDGVRTGAQAHATLALPRRARLLIKGNTVVHFKHSLDGTAPSDQIEVQHGELTIETGALDLGVSTSHGVVKLTRETSVRMRAEQEKTHFDVMIGRVEYTRDGATQTAQTGDGFDLDVLSASVERVEKEPAPFAATVQPSAELQPSAKAVTEKPEATSGTIALDKLTFQDPPPTSIVTLPAGESAVIHDPAPPSAVRMTFSDCPELGVVEFDRGNGRFDALRVRGTGEVRARIPRGAFKYRLRCARAGRVQTSSVRTGRLTVMIDAATRPLPLAPVTITADADGRRYTVSYQNRLPIITLRWPDAPHANRYRLLVQPDKGSQISVESGRSSITLEPGRVGEGLHQFWFETGDKKRSERGLLQVSFDYAARTAYLTSPSEGASTQERRARFAGGTLSGSTVQVQGAPMKLDAQGRFTSNIEVPADVGGAYVRVQHPSTGIHYYVRHLR
ncbi:MAG TPA: FecR domain-containing protein [Polyangiales bacterium]|nr:FecR domain-containing protein [Polyangiales bacterium]